MKKAGYRKAGVTIVLLLVAFLSATAVPCREVVGYYAGWKWYKRNKLVNPETIDYSRYTVINYAFFRPLADGSVTEGDAWADANILLGKISQQGHDKKSSLVYRARLSGVKVVGSIGGWTWSSVFPSIAGDAGKRRQFALSCVELIRKYDLDGVDIDWEYPGFKAHNGTPSDKQHFTLLLAEVRRAFDAYESETGRPLMLTAAVGPSEEHMSHIEWDRVTELLDIIHVMTYNYYGAWDKTTNHNTPLYPPASGSKSYNINHTMNRLIHFYGVPPGKITLGLAFYGRSVSTPGEPSLHGISNGVPDAVTFPDERGTPSYYSIVGKSDRYTLNRDELSGVPYLTGRKGLGSFVSFDDPGSIGLKAAYAMKAGLKGVVIWDISGDYLETSPGSGKISGTPLCDAVHSVFCTAIGPDENRRTPSEIGLVVFPNPFRDELDIRWNAGCDVIEVKISNSSGTGIMKHTHPGSDQLKLNTAGWKSGMYFIQLLTPGGQAVEKVIRL